MKELDEMQKQCVDRRNEINDIQRILQRNIKIGRIVIIIGIIFSIIGILSLVANVCTAEEIQRFSTANGEFNLHPFGLIRGQQELGNCLYMPMGGVEDSALYIDPEKGQFERVENYRFDFQLNDVDVNVTWTLIWGTDGSKYVYYPPNKNSKSSYIKKLNNDVISLLYTEYKRRNK